MSSHLAVALVRVVGAVGRRVALPAQGNAEAVAAAELALITRREICRAAGTPVRHGSASTFQ